MNLNEIIICERTHIKYNLDSLVFSSFSLCLPLSFHPFCARARSHTHMQTLFVSSLFSLSPYIYSFCLFSVFLEQISIKCKIKGEEDDDEGEEEEGEDLSPICYPKHFYGRLKHIECLVRVTS